MALPPLITEVRVGRVARTATLLVTNAIKLSGLAAALNELLLRPNLRTSAVALAGFMMAGAQLSEKAVLAALDRILGHPVEEPAAAEKTGAKAP